MDFSGKKNWWGQAKKNAKKLLQKFILFSSLSSYRVISAGAQGLCMRTSSIHIIIALQSMKT